MKNTTHKLLILLLILSVSCLALVSCVAAAVEIVFDPNYDGAQTTSAKVAVGQKVNPPANVTRQGYQLVGWYWDKSCTSPLSSRTASKNATVYARWIPVPTALQLTYDGQLFQGSVLPKSDITATVTYGDGSTQTVTDFDINLSGIADKLGQASVSASYTENGVTVQGTLSLAVQKVVLVGISVRYTGDTVETGSQIDKSQISVVANYNNGTNKPVQEFSVGQLDTTTVGEKEVSVSFTEDEVTVSNTFHVTVVKAALAQISAQSNAVIYEEDSFDKSMLEVTATYGDQTTTAVTNFEVAWPTSVSGKQTATVTYTERGVTKTTTVELDILPIIFSALTVTYDGNLFDGDNLNNADFTVTGIYATNRTKAVTQFEVTGYDAETVGEQQLTVACTNVDSTVVSAKVTVNVQRRTPVLLEVSYSGKVALGEQPVDELFTVTVTFNNNTRQNVQGCTKPLLDSSTKGKKSLEVSYTYFDVTVTCTVTIAVYDPDAPSQLDIHFLELGNKYTGDCIYIKAGETDILIDAGSRQSSAATITQYVNKYCTDGKLEYVIATHADQDHISGFVGTTEAKGIFETYECETIIQFARTNKTTQVYKDYCTKRDAEVAAGAKLYTALDCVKEQNGAKKVYELTEDGSITMEVLYQKFYENNSGDENNYSVCLLFKQEDNYFLFTGDLESAGETSLVSSNPNLPHCVLYKAGHHGSKTSSGLPLLSKITPEYVCVCCCAGSTEYTTNNPNTFPTQIMIDNVAPYTDRVYVTTLCTNYSGGRYESMNGDICISCDGSEIILTCSNNTTKLKDTQWFKENRTMPKAWEDNTSLYHD